jgi:hypothetical protein
LCVKYNVEVLTFLYFKQVLLCVKYNVEVLTFLYFKQVLLCVKYNVEVLTFLYFKQVLLCVKYNVEVLTFLYFWLSRSISHIRCRYIYELFRCIISGLLISFYCYTMDNSKCL